MPSAIFERFTSWLGLLLGVCTALLPPQGLVLCVEADGCVSVEFAAAQSDCGGCEGHAPGHLPPASGAEPRADAKPSAGNECACVDVPVPGSAQDQRLPTKAGASGGDPLLALAAPTLSCVCDQGPTPGRRLVCAAPRPPDALRHLRSIVLLV